MAEQRSYTGEHISVGVDVHKATYTVTCVCQRQMVKTATVPAAQAQEGIAKVYRSAPGIGEVVARTLATELGDMTRFANERALFSSTGLTPSAYSSGASMRRGHISRQGASRLRHVLVETA
jgi:transposase